jgi:dolichol-phosphate mannosyltransferase
MVRPISNKDDGGDFVPKERIFVVIPSYRASETIVEVLAGIGPEVEKIVVVDDFCPDGTGEIAQELGNPRVHVIWHNTNRGVGGAMVTGYHYALESGADIVVKIDADGQMDTSRITKLVEPIISRRTDYAKGNRFDDLSSLRIMPKVRLFGNAVLSLFTKFSSGYWSINDPTNGFTAIHRSSLVRIEMTKLSQRYFFESDMLYRLSTIRAVVIDVPMPAIYGRESSNLSVLKSAIQFPFLHARNLVKRLVYKYFLREWSVASLELIMGILLVWFGALFGLANFFHALSMNRGITAGQAVLFAVSLIVGFQLLLSALNYDVESEPSSPRQLDLENQ